MTTGAEDSEKLSHSSYAARQIYFPFFPGITRKDWLIELQLWDKTHDRVPWAEGQPCDAVLSASEREFGGEMDYSTEVVTPMYENLYVKKFVLFANETVEILFQGDH